MILHLNPWQSHYGAAHRKNIDTPSLVGMRLEPIGSSGKHHRKQAACREARFGRFHWEQRQAGLRRISDAFTDL